MNVLRRCYTATYHVFRALLNGGVDLISRAPLVVRRLGPFWRLRRVVRHGFVRADRYRSIGYARRAYAFYDWHGHTVVTGARSPGEAREWADRRQSGRSAYR